jgi:hypothetical protein
MSIVPYLQLVKRMWYSSLIVASPATVAADEKKAQPANHDQRSA